MLFKIGVKNNELRVVYPIAFTFVILKVLRIKQLL